MKRRTLIATAAALGMLASTPMALADEWRPSRPMTMVIGFAAGGSTDIQGRVLAPVLEEYFGQPVNVVNQPGGASAVALTRFLNAEPDGHTFVFGSLMGLTFSPLVTPVEYTMDSFRFGPTLVGAQFAVVTGGDSPFETFEDLVEHGRENPLTYAQQSPLDQVIMQRIAEQEGIDLAIVPTGGGGGVAPLLLGGEVDFAFSGGIHSQYAPTGDMRILAFMTLERSPFYPDVPTLLELGYDFGIMDDARPFILLADTPDEVMAAFEGAAAFAAEHPSFQEVVVETTQHPLMLLDGDGTAEVAGIIRAANEGLMAD